ncbi:MAG: hypothetical protein U0354_11790 [Candidatus Sericytochromatia bacterium]
MKKDFRNVCMLFLSIFTIITACSPPNTYIKKINNENISDKNKLSTEKKNFSVKNNKICTLSPYQGVGGVSFTADVESKYPVGDHYYNINTFATAELDCYCPSFAGWITIFKEETKNTSIDTSTFPNPVYPNIGWVFNFNSTSIDYTFGFTRLSSGAGVTGYGNIPMRRVKEGTTFTLNKRADYSAWNIDAYEEANLTGRFTNSKIIVNGSYYVYDNQPNMSSYHGASNIPKTTKYSSIYGETSIPQRCLAFNISTPSEGINILNINPDGSDAWTIKVKKDSTEKVYTGSGQQQISFNGDGLPEGIYNAEAYFNDDPDNKLTDTLEVKHELDLKKVPEEQEFISPKTADGYLDDIKFDVIASSEWELKVNGKKPDIINADGTTTQGEPCTWTKLGNGNQNGVSWNGTCSDGSFMVDGNYTVELSSPSGSSSKSKSIKIDNTSPEIENLDIQETDTNITLEAILKEPQVNGVSSGLDNDSIDMIVSDSSLGGTISKSGSSIKYTINKTISKNNKNQIDITDSLSQGIIKIIAKDKIKNNFNNLLDGVKTEVSLISEDLVKTSNSFSIKASPSSNDFLITGIPCKGLKARIKIPVAPVFISGKTTVGVRRLGSGTLYMKPISYTLLDYDFNANAVIKIVDISDALLTLPTGDYITTTFGGVIRYLTDVDFTVNAITGNFRAKHINDIRNDSYISSSEIKDIEHIFGKKNLVKHKFDTLINSGISPQSIIKQTIDSINFCNLKSGIIPRNYIDPITGTTGIRVSVASLGVEIVVRGNYDNGILDISTMFIP